MGIPAEAESKAARLFFLAQTLAQCAPGFWDVKGPGPGNGATTAFLSALRKMSLDTFGRDYSEARVCGQTGYALDFYFPDEGTAVEVAFLLTNPNSEYERDVFKCLLAQSAGHRVTKLLFITKPGGFQKQNAPGPRAIAQWAALRFDLDIEILELRDERSEQT
jgi:hypothetical protein